MTTWMRFGFVALCGVLGAGCLSETRYVCPPGSDITASVRCGAACASGELSASQCVEVRAACADGRLTALDCAGIDGDMGMPDAGDDLGGDLGSDADVMPDMGVDLGPCGMACGGSTPLCNPVSMMCVQCVSMGDCEGATPECNAAGQCVECLDETDCGGDTPVCLSGECVGCADGDDCDASNPVCDPLTHECGPCTARVQCFDYATTPACNTVTGECAACDVPNESADCADTPTTPACNATTQQCVQCRQNSNCTNPNASRCTGTNTCAPCTINADCSHIAGRNRCDAGTCRQCTPATEATDCGANSCNPATFMCTTTPRLSRRVCESCVADSECIQASGTFRCIPMTYMGTPRPGGYCMRATPGCMRPFLTGITATSVSGSPSTTYCGIDQTSISCEAVRAMIEGRGCAGDDASACMAEGALCETVDVGPDLCTYPCASATQCIGSLTCNAGYCGS